MTVRQEATDPSAARKDGVLAIPGVVCVTDPTPSGGRVVHVGPAAGWMEPAGIQSWSHEVSVVAREDLSEELCRDLRLLLPEHRVLAIKYPRSHKAAKTAPLFSVSSEVAKALTERGVRVFTVGFDRITGGFFFFAQGGGKDPVSLQGDLFQAIAPSLEAGDSRGEIDACLDGLVDRLLVEKSDGVLTELAVELAAQLPRLADAGAERPELDAFEQRLAEIEAGAARFEGAAREMVSALGKGALRGDRRAEIPLWGEATRQEQPVLALQMIGGEGGKTTFVQLPARERWEVRGPVRDVTVDAGKAVAEKAAAEKLAAAQKAAAEKLAAAEKAAAEKLAAAQKAAEKAAAEQAAAERRVAAEKAATERRAAAEKVAAERRVAAEKAAAEKAAADKAAAERRVAAEKAGVERRAAVEKAAAERRAAVEKAAAEKGAAEKAAEEKRVAAEKAAADKRAAAEKAAAEKAAAEKRAAAEKAAAEKRAAAEKAAAEKAAAEKRAAAERAASDEAEAEQAAAEQAAAERRVAADKRIAAEKAAAERQAAEKKKVADRKADKKKKKGAWKKGGEKKSEPPKARATPSDAPSKAAAPAKAVAPAKAAAPAKAVAPANPTDTKQLPIPPVSDNKKSMYVGVAAVVVVLALVAVWALFLRN